MHYSALVEDALRGVVRQAVRTAAEQGLPGDHHFYLTCRTGPDGLVLPPALRDSYPEEITLVLQHQFWDLELHDDRFEVTLSFNGRNERLRVPWSAITGFVDPAVEFGLQFKALSEAATPEDSAPEPVAAATPDAAGDDADSGDKSRADSGDKSRADSGDSPREPKVVQLDTFRRG